MENPVRSGERRRYLQLLPILLFGSISKGGRTPTPQEARHVLQLRDVVLPKVAVLGQQRKVLQVFPAGVGGVQLVKLPVDDGPRLHLLLCELDPGNGIATATARFSQRQGNVGGFHNAWRENSLFVGHGQIGKVLSPLSVDVVLETLVEMEEGHVRRSLAEGLGLLEFVYVRDGRRPARSRTSARGWRSCPSLQSSWGTRGPHTCLRREGPDGPACSSV